MKRDTKLDGLKFVLIFLVVLSHLRYNDYGLLVNRMIFSFCMPVFVFMSGYFTSLNADRAKKIAWVKKTALIYLFAQLAHIVLAVILRLAPASQGVAVSHTHLISLHDFIAPKFAIWYILCLIYWRLAIWNMPKKINDAALLIGSLILSVLAGFVPVDQSLSFQRAFSFFPFFVFGVIFKKRNMMEKLEKVHLFVPIIVLIVSLLIARELPLFQPKEHFRSLNDAVFKNFPIITRTIDVPFDNTTLKGISAVGQSRSIRDVYSLDFHRPYLFDRYRKKLYTGFGYKL